MLVNDLKKSYDSECVYYSHDHDPETYKVWRDVLGNYDERDLKRALSLWHANNEEVQSFGASRAQGSFFPKASDLRLIIERGKSQERDSAKQFVPCNQEQRNVDVNGSNWPELFCSGGHLYLRTTQVIYDGHRVEIRQNSAVRPMRNCSCWLRWERESAA